MTLLQGCSLKTMVLQTRPWAGQPPHIPRVHRSVGNATPASFSSSFLPPSHLRLLGSREPNVVLLYNVALKLHNRFKGLSRRGQLLRGPPSSRIKNLGMPNAHASSL